MRNQITETHKKSVKRDQDRYFQSDIKTFQPYQTVIKIKRMKVNWNKMDIMCNEESDLAQCIEGVTKHAIPEFIDDFLADQPISEPKFAHYTR